MKTLELLTMTLHEILCMLAFDNFDLNNGHDNENQEDRIFSTLTKGPIRLPKGMNFHKSSKGGGVISDPTNHIAKFPSYWVYI